MNHPLSPQAPSLLSNPQPAATLEVGEATHDELTWFFGEALRDLEGPPRHAPALSGLCGGALWPIEVLAEAFHAASKIHARLRRLPERDVRLLEALFTERIDDGPEDVPPDLVRAYERALAAYERVRGDGPSVVPGDDR